MADDKERAHESLADPHLLEKIDQLFAYNVGEYIDLPQLVVIGDQSSGKSSVLEGLTDLPFPRDSGLCTRFATQITFRRDPVKRINIFVIPARNASNEHAATVRAFSKSGLEDLEPAVFAEIMREVQTVMGVSATTAELKQSTTFSEDVLRLEICGPNEDHLTVIDVPGIFRKTTEGVTTKQDRDMVRSMVISYMTNPRSLMLAVIPANVDIATQEILDMASEVDPQGHRTIGVLTKPDLVDKGAHRPVLDLLEGKRHKLSLGWHIVRNPGQQQLDAADSTANRHMLEKEFFRRESPWDSVDKTKCGIPTLRHKLQGVLASHIRREFPKVKSEINKKLQACKQALKELGVERGTTHEQRIYLLDMAMEFQSLVDLAIDARYGGLEIFETSPYLKLATAVVSRNEQFGTMMADYGHTFQYSAGTEQDNPPEQNNDEIFQGDEKEPEEEEGEESGKGSDEDEDLPFKVRLIKDESDLEDMAFHQTTIGEPEAGNILGWIKQVYETSRGFELGTFDASLLAVTMRKQSAKWEALAKGYISDIATIIHRFILVLLQHVCPDERARTGLLDLLNDNLLGLYKPAFDQVNFLLQVERGGTPTTLNHYFNDNLEKSRQKRVQAMAEKDAFEMTLSKWAGPQKLVKVDSIMKHHPMSNANHVVQDIHDILQSYYKVARKRFVDNICMQGAAFHLISGPQTPLKLFSPKFVISMTEEQLEEVAGEDLVLKRKRADLKKEMKDLEAGRRVLN